MIKFRIGLIVVSICLLVAYVILIWQSGWDWQNNKSHYLGMGVPVLVIILMLVSNREEKQKLK